MRKTYHDSTRTLLKEIYEVKDSLSHIPDGEYKSYFLNGNIQSKGRFHDSKTTGQWEFYYESGKLRMRGGLEDNVHIRRWEYFYENGRKSMEGQISEGKREGLWLFYYESGELESEGTFKQGARDGFWKDYHKNGQVSGQATYRADSAVYVGYHFSGKIQSQGKKIRGKSEGLWKFYYENEGMEAIGHYEKGLREGEWLYYHPNGTLSARGTFSHDMPEGAWEYYGPSGSVDSKGSFQKGVKEGEWNVFYPDGALKGKGNFSNGSGPYTEYFGTGELRAKGSVAQGSRQGLWQYYHKNGKLSGKCVFKDGEGSYTGYYEDGSTPKSKGKIKDDERVGKWELYNKDGSLAGYYRPFYEKEPVQEAVPVQLGEEKKESRTNGVADYRFRKSRFRYFDSKVNEFHGLILAANPLASLVGYFPVSLELYFQQRLGYELEIQGVRDPFFKKDKAIPHQETFKRGYTISLRQKLYNPDNRFGMWYFGHELRYSKLNHFANIHNPQPPLQFVTASADEQKVEYSLLFGYRLMTSATEGGFTIDGFWGFGIGVRGFDTLESYEEAFRPLPQSTIAFPLRIGLNIGYTFPARLKRKG